MYLSNGLAFCLQTMTHLQLEYRSQLFFSVNWNSIYSKHVAEILETVCRESSQKQYILAGSHDITELICNEFLRSYMQLGHCSDLFSQALMVQRSMGLARETSSDP